MPSTYKSKLLCWLFSLFLQESSMAVSLLISSDYSEPDDPSCNCEDSPRVLSKFHAQRQYEALVVSATTGQPLTSANFQYEDKVDQLFFAINYNTHDPCVLMFQGRRIKGGATLASVLSLSNATSIESYQSERSSSVCDCPTSNTDVEQFQPPSVIRPPSNTNMITLNFTAYTYSEVLTSWSAHPWFQNTEIKQLKDDKFFVLAAIQYNWACIRHVSEELRSDLDVIKAVVRKRGVAMKYLNLHKLQMSDLIQVSLLALQDNRIYPDLIIPMLPRALFSESEFVLGAIKQTKGITILRYADLRLTTNVSFLLRCLSVRPDALTGYLPDYLIKEIQEEASLVQSFERTTLQRLLFTKTLTKKEKADQDALRLQMKDKKFVTFLLNEDSQDLSHVSFWANMQKESFADWQSPL